MATLRPTAKAILFPSGSGRGYESYPVGARNGDGRTVVLWRDATDHAIDHGAVTRGKTSDDDGATWSSSFVAYDDADPLVEASFVGVDVLPDESFLGLILLKKFADATTKTVSKYGARLATSTDGQAWQLLPELDLSAMNWFFVSEVTVDETGAVMVSGYGARSSGARQGAYYITTASLAAPAWSAFTAWPGQDSTVKYSEPQLCRTSTGWVVSIRADDNQVWSSTSTGPDWSAWNQTAPVLSGFAGNPEMCRVGDGTLVMLLRLTPVVDGTHGNWSWATSTDDGASWVVQSGFPEDTRYMMYGVLLATPDGGALCVFASEDDPTQLWKNSSVWQTRFVIDSLSVELYQQDGYPLGVRIHSTTDAVVYQCYSGDNGYTVRSQVRPAPGGVDLVDYEVQPGRLVWWESNGQTSTKLEFPTEPMVWFINPLAPERSIPVVFGDDTSARDYPIDVSVNRLPGAPFAVVSQSGGLGSPEGQTELVSDTLPQKAAILALIADGGAVFVRQHVGFDFPAWVWVTKLSEQKVVNYCGDYRRRWSFSWVAVDRPSPVAVARRRNINDLKQPIDTLLTPIDDL